MIYVLVFVIIVYKSSDLCLLLSLQLCVILEPMQELMSRHKAYGLNPRDCLKTTLFQKWQRMVAPPGSKPKRTGTAVELLPVTVGLG